MSAAKRYHSLEVEETHCKGGSVSACGSCASSTGMESQPGLGGMRGIGLAGINFCGNSHTSGGQGSSSAVTSH